MYALSTGLRSVMAAWKFITKEFGAPFVVRVGAHQIPPWLVGNWALRIPVQPRVMFFIRFYYRNVS